MYIGKDDPPRGEAAEGRSLEPPRRATKNIMFSVYGRPVLHSLTHSPAPYHLEVALAARLIISLCPFPRALPAVVCTQKIGTVYSL